ncbi:TPA: fimbria/pilus outer membrane usher protein, partial [Escherichia coli]|nr:fimbria/pilus outer membrane usher protein [Escherichia coli]
IPGVKGVSVNSSMPTNSRGNTVVWLSEYSENSININMDNVPDNMEFETTSYKVVPTEGAMVYRKFGFENVLRYILRVKDAQGNYLTGGDAKTEQGLNAGFISNNGVLLMNMLAEPTSVSVDTGDGKQCRFSMAGLKANTNKVQEVRCE